MKQQITLGSAGGGREGKLQGGRRGERMEKTTAGEEGGMNREWRYVLSMSGWGIGCERGEFGRSMAHNVNPDIAETNQ